MSLGRLIDLPRLKQLLQLLQHVRLLFTSVLALTLVIAILAPLRPYLIQLIIDGYLPARNVEWVGIMTAIMLGLLFLQSMIQYVHVYYAAVLGQEIIHQLRQRVFQHLQRLKLHFHDKTPVGQLVTRCVSDTETLSNVFSEGLASILSDILQLIVIFVFMLFLDWKLTIVSLSTLPVLLFCTYIFKEKIKKSFTRVRNAVSKLNSFLQEHISGMNIVQLFSEQPRAMDEFKAINRQHRQANMASVLYYSVYFPLSQIIQAVSIGLLVWYGAGAIIQAHTTLGMVISFVMYIQLFFRPMHAIADRFNTLQLGMVSTTRLMDLLAQRSYIPDTGTFDTIPPEAAIVFKNVWFTYNPPTAPLASSSASDSTPWILQDISFEVPHGCVTALVGATGSGKTSTIRLLSRLYEIQKGSICLGGRSIDAYTLSTLRSQIGFVSQEVFLFSASLRDNIALCNPQITDARILEAAEQIGANTLIDELPGGLDYVAAERGANLSAGQRQMLAFLRVMVFDPTIVLLDEATSSIDSQTEQLIDRKSVV